ncbi:MAG: M48 family metalloprotease, partial [Gammaproteobacteria bacterium]|nr:M48 family metalloprotease [Gammaproteobacteria bacterium]
MIPGTMPRYLSSLSTGFLCGINLYALVLVLLLPAQSLVHAQGSTLPELGEAATRYLSPDDEQMIGRRFLRELMATDSYISDHELRHYLNGLGKRIGSKASLGGITPKLNLIRENEINAFAVPGGYITFNSGLMLTTENESELASVVGHEIAHLSQRHLPR